MSSFATYPPHLYIHWPFCSKKCHFCDFVAFEQHAQYQDAYHENLLNEIKAFASLMAPLQQQPISTIFIGGGTPSLYPPEQLTQLFTTIKEQFDLSQAQEISIELNPSDIDEEKLSVWQECGITRLSIGVQALDDQVLAKLNRRQRILDVHNAMRYAPKYFKNISIDLILGLPDVTPETWRKTLQEVVTWPINHLSIYFLTIHEKTPLYFKVSSGSVTLASDDQLVDLYEETIDTLAKHGFEQYETSNFAKKGHQSIHNKAYWNRKPYKGFGIGASSFDGSTRFTTTNNLPTYLAHDFSTSAVAPCTQETLPIKAVILELLMLGLRQKSGVNLQDVVYYLDGASRERFFESITRLKHGGFLEQIDDIIRLTTRGMALEHEIVAQLV